MGCPRWRHGRQLEGPRVRGLADVSRHFETGSVALDLNAAGETFVERWLADTAGPALSKLGESSRSDTLARL